MHARRLLLAALIFPAFTLSAQQHGGAAPSVATIAAVPSLAAEADVSPAAKPEQSLIAYGSGRGATNLSIMKHLLDIGA